MKSLFASVIFTVFISFISAQPCKQVRVGMTSAEVLKAVGKPTEIDTLGSESPVRNKGLIMVWQYGDPDKEGNQRVEFSGNSVTNIIADGKKFDELIFALKQGKIPKGELEKRIEKINREGCK